jgi:hypothetical protein
MNRGDVARATVLFSLVLPALVASAADESRTRLTPVRGESKAQEVAKVSFTTTVSKDKTVVGKPRLVVTGDHGGTVEFAPDNSNQRFSVVYKTHLLTNRDVTAEIAAKIDDREVATGTLAVIKGKSSDITLQGGGFTWHIEAVHVEKESSNTGDTTRPGGRLR